MMTNKSSVLTNKTMLKRPASRTVEDSGSANLTNKALSENVETVFRLTGAPVVDVLATLHDARARAKLWDGVA